ncbi:MAG TPA: hypothetical protein H9881_16240 [Candidatus Stackebrandtia excrementipullorum]|nr:hypothetical protein [Candidatus Stackebrandtia excrementipullorum]
MDIEQQLDEVAETDRFAVEVQTRILEARGRFVKLLPQFMAVRATGSASEKRDAERLLPDVLGTLDYIDSCMEHARTVRADMARLHYELTMQRDGRDYTARDA